MTRDNKWLVGRLTEQAISFLSSRLWPGVRGPGVSPVALRNPPQVGPFSKEAFKLETNQDRSVSHAPQIIGMADSAEGYRGWHEPSVAEWQNSAYRELLDQMHGGNTRLDLQVAAAAVRDSAVTNPSLLEVGCGSGYYSEVFAYLSDSQVAYTGLDYSEAMISLAKRQYPDVRFEVGDATSLRFDDDAFDIVMNGAALMHMPAYEKAIVEARRVARNWCVYHTVPMVVRRPTAVLRKEAYGAPVFEITFNRTHFETILETNGLRVHKIYDNIPHDYLSEAMGEPVFAYTYLCEVRKNA